MSGTEAEPASGERRSVNPEYRPSPEITTRAGGVFWGLVLLITGFVWLAANLGLIELNVNLLLPFVVIVAGLYLLIAKVVR